MNSINLVIPNLQEGQILKIEMIGEKILISMNSKPSEEKESPIKPTEVLPRQNIPTFRVNIPRQDYPKKKFNNRQNFQKKKFDKRNYPKEKVFSRPPTHKSLDEIITEEEKKPYNLRKYLK